MSGATLCDRCYGAGYRGAPLPTSEHDSDGSNGPAVTCLLVIESEFNIVNFPVATVEQTKVSMNSCTAQFFSGEYTLHQEDKPQSLDFAAKRQNCVPLLRLSRYATGKLLAAHPFQVLA